MDNYRNVLGIDLGTTYSCVAQVDEFDRVVVFQNTESKFTTPSVVYFSNDETLVGDRAKEYSKLEPENTVPFIKRQMSKDEAFEKPTKFPKGLTPTEISAYILKKIVQDANATRTDSKPITKVVITCPAYFGTTERKRVKEAGEIAGLEVLAIINEPTAAAIAYGQETKGEKTVLVYDLGGGTFDVTLIKISGNNITALATDGNSGLGGYDWDKKLAEYLLVEYNKQKGTSYEMEEGTALFNEMMLFAEEQKIRLSAKTTLNTILTLKGDSAKIEITRDIFDTLTCGLLNETIEKTHEVLAVGKEKNVDFPDEVLLVGGSSKMPQIKAKIDSEFNCNAKIKDPDWCVAKGAAILALNKSFILEEEKYAFGERNEKPQVLTGGVRINAVNVTSKNYAIELQGDVVKNIIFSNTPLDGNCRGEGNFIVPVTGCTSLVFPVYESDNRTEGTYDKEIATYLGEDSLAIPSSSKEGDPIKMIFEVDTEGILHIHGEVLGREINFEIKLPGTLGKDEIEEKKAQLATENVE